MALNYGSVEGRAAWTVFSMNEAPISVLQRLTGWAEYEKATWSAAVSPRHSDITVLVSRDCTDINSGERSKLVESQITLCHLNG
jgi:hypothetical protein